MRDITEGVTRYPPHKCLSCQLRVKGQSRGLGQLGVKEVILEGLLIGQGLDVVPDCVGPVINSS
jgi:hypothetical protein